MPEHDGHGDARESGAGIGVVRPFELQIAYNGVVRSLDHVSPNERVGALLERALKLFNVIDRPHNHSLFFEGSTTPIDPDQSVGQAGIESGALLFLRPRDPQGGGH
ncbi:MAG: hypothetical protein AB7N24_15330 [Dehalococcoidia bacterium]